MGSLPSYHYVLKFFQQCSINRVRFNVGVKVSFRVMIRVFSLRFRVAWRGNFHGA